MFNKVLSFTDTVIQALNGERSGIELTVQYPGDYYYWTGPTYFPRTVTITKTIVLDCLLCNTVETLNHTLQYYVDFDPIEGDYHNKPPALTTEEFMAIYGRYLEIVERDENGVPTLGIDLSHYDLSEIKVLYDLDLRNAKLFRTDLSNIKIVKGQFDGADLSLAGLTQAQITFSSFKGANLSHVEGRGADLRKGDFTGADLSHAMFAEAIFLKKAIFRNAILIDTVLYDAAYAEADFTDAVMHGIKVSNSIKDVIRNVPIQCGHYYLNGLRYPESGEFKVQNTDLVFENEFELLENKGGGAYALVYKAYNPLSESSIALRIFPIDIADEIAQLRIHFKKINHLAKEHPGLIQYHWVKPVNQRLVLIFIDHIEGKTLTTHLQGTPGISAPQKIGYVLQILATLRLCHENKVFHGDLHGENIMVTKDGEIKLIDFFPPYTKDAEQNTLTDITALGEVLLQMFAPAALSTWMTSRTSAGLLDTLGYGIFAQTNSGLLTQIIHRCLAAGLTEAEREHITYFRTIAEIEREFQRITLK